jgi:hypothetical protein
MNIFAEYLPAVSETVAASVISTYLYSIITFPSSPVFRDFVIYRHSVSGRIEPHWVTVANDRREKCLGTRDGIRTSRQRSDEDETHLIRYETSGLRARHRLQPHSPIWIR